MKYILFVEADYNDADYVQQEMQIDESELPEIRRLFRIVEENDSKFPTSEYSSKSVEDVYENVLTSAEMDKLWQFVPYGEFGVHTIQRVEIRPLEPIERII